MKYKGITAIEVIVSLVIIAILGLIVLGCIVYGYSCYGEQFAKLRIWIKTEQHEELIGKECETE